MQKSGIGIRVNTGLSGFVLIDRITEIGPDAISGIRHFSGDPVALGIESLAQLGAYHVRHTVRFERHAFLLKINRCRLPEGLMPEGTCLLTGKVQGRSASAFTYGLQATLSGKTIMEGVFMFAVVDYDPSFNKELLQNHYQRVFSCLQKNTGTGC